ncbi:hypothetical protein [Burkholderia gladioli]|uniref:hypothetical protein n=1 Tax=Burkholderia gladioli TaxID=28095 RepID=UPI00163FD3B2|nr:hypothetical protein [Burkholderia gladioli]
MSILQHTIDSPDGATPAHQDRVVIGVIPGIANAAGSGAGAAVTTTVALPASANLPANYAVLVNPGQDATAFVPSGSKTPNSFNVTLTPRLAANTVAAGTFDVVILA